MLAMLDVVWVGPTVQVRPGLVTVVKTHIVKNYDGRVVLILDK